MPHIFGSSLIIHNGTVFEMVCPLWLPFLSFALTIYRSICLVVLQFLLSFALSIYRSIRLIVLQFLLFTSVLARSRVSAFILHPLCVGELRMTRGCLKGELSFTISHIFASSSLIIDNGTRSRVSAFVLHLLRVGELRTSKGRHKGELCLTISHIFASSLIIDNGTVFFR